MKLQVKKREIVMVGINKPISSLLPGLLIMTLSIQMAYGEVCPTNTKQDIQSDLATALGQKANVDNHLQKVHDMMHSVQGNANTSQQTIDTLKQAESNDLDAIKKLNEQIDGDQSCLQSTSCTEIVQVEHITGHVVLASGASVSDVQSVCELQPGDEVRTGKDGSADLVILAGKRTIHLGPDMDFKMPAANSIAHLLDDPERDLVVILGVRG